MLIFAVVLWQKSVAREVAGEGQGTHDMIKAFT